MRLVTADGFSIWHVRCTGVDGCRYSLVRRFWALRSRVIGKVVLQEKLCYPEVKSWLNEGRCDSRRANSFQRKK